MHESEDNAADHIIDPARSRRDPPGTFRDAEGRLRVPLDRPDPDLGGPPNFGGCGGYSHRDGHLRPWPDDDDGWAPPADAFNYGLDSDPETSPWDGGEAPRNLLTAAQQAALAAVPGLATTLYLSPFCEELVQGAIRVGETAVGAEAGDAQDRALHRIRRLVFAHRLTSRLLEAACQRAIDKDLVSEDFKGAAVTFRTVYKPADGTAGAEHAARMADYIFPELYESADKVAARLSHAAAVAPAPTATVQRLLEEAVAPAAAVDWLAPAAAVHWLALGDDDLGLLDVFLDAVATVGGLPGASEACQETARAVMPRVFAQLPAVAEVFGGNSLSRAMWLGSSAVEVMMDLAIRGAQAKSHAAKPAADGPDASTDRA